MSEDSLLYVSSDSFGACPTKRRYLGQTETKRAKTGPRRAERVRRAGRPRGRAKLRKPLQKGPRHDAGRRWLPAACNRAEIVSNTTRNWRRWFVSRNLYLLATHRPGSSVVWPRGPAARSRLPAGHEVSRHRDVVQSAVPCDPCAQFRITDTFRGSQDIRRGEGAERLFTGNQSLVRG